MIQSKRKPPPSPVPEPDEDDVVECSSPPCSIAQFADDYFAQHPPAAEAGKPVRKRRPR